MRNLLPKSDLGRCLGFLGLGLLLCLPMILWQTIPQKDAQYYYVPMIRAFALGHWEHAYWPMIPPLFSTFGGLVAMALPVSAFTAAKIVSSLFYAGTIFPLYFLNKRVFNGKIAVGSVFLYLFCDRLLRYGGAGIIDSGKVFFLTLAVYCLVEFRHRHRWGQSALFGVALAGLALSRGEGIAVSALLLGIALFVELFSGHKKGSWAWRSCLPKHSIFVFAVMLLLLAPWLTYQYHHAGYPVIDRRQISFVPFKELLRNKQELALPTEPAALAELRAEFHPANTVPTDPRSLWERLFVEIFKGFYPLYLLLYLPVILWRWRRRQWTTTESLLLAVALLHTVILVAALGGTWVQKRYVIAALPLLTGWTAIGFFGLFGFARAKTRASKLRFLPATVVVLVALGLLWSATSRTRPSSSRRKQQKLALTKQCAQWLRNQGPNYLLAKSLPLFSDQQTYHNGQCTTVLANSCLPVFLGAGDWICPHNYRRHYSKAQIVRLCRLKEVHFILMEDALSQFGEDFIQLGQEPKFMVMKSFQEGNYSASILGFKENLAITE